MLNENFSFNVLLDSNVASVDDPCSVTESCMLRSFTDRSQISFRSRIFAVVGLYLACPSRNINLLFTTLHSKIRSSEVQATSSTKIDAICHIEINLRKNSFISIGFLFV